MEAVLNVGVMFKEKRKVKRRKKNPLNKELIILICSVVALILWFSTSSYFAYVVGASWVSDWYIYVMCLLVSVVPSFGLMWILIKRSLR